MIFYLDLDIKSFTQREQSQKGKFVFLDYLFLSRISLTQCTALNFCFIPLLVYILSKLEYKKVFVF